MYDIAIIGGGTAGCACAYIAGKLGLKTLLVEKNIHLGGAITSGFVTPVMKTASQNINCEFYNDFVQYMKKYNAQITYYDGNTGWFNPEIAKIVLDVMMNNVSVDVVYDCNISNITTRNNTITSFDIELNNVCSNYKNVNVNNSTRNSTIILDDKLSNTNRNVTIKSLSDNNLLSLHIESKYFVDTTGDGNFCKKINHNFLENENNFQALTLRFLISGIDLEKFKDWVTKIDPNQEVTNCYYVDGQLHLTTAYTWDNKDWGLTPVFEKAVQNKDLTPADTAYFQLFTVAGMPGTVSLNCPRIMADRNLDPLNPIDRSLALKLGRQQIWRLYNFCKKYFEGFENSFISNIADSLGIRESGRIEGKYVMTENDIIAGKLFDKPACASDYPIDVHSTKKDNSELKFVRQPYTMPIEALMSKEYDNLFFAGRCFSGSFKAQAALRTQKNCFSMGEAVARKIQTMLKS